MKRPVVIIVGAAAGALLVAGIGASAHTVSVDRLTGERSATVGDEASETRVTAPEPVEQPEAPEAPKVEAPEPPEMDEDEDNDEQGEQEGAPNTTVQQPSGEHESDHHSATSQPERD